MRSKNSFINIVISCTSYLILTLSAFLVRSVFSRVLGGLILGLDKQFTDAVSMLAIVELGLGTGIVYKLYQPIADHDIKKISLLIRFYKNAYKVISAIILGLGFITTFIAPYSFKADDLRSLYSQGYNNLIIYAVYLFYVFDVLASYLNAHKRAMLMADQKNYISSIYHTIFLCLAYFSQIFVLSLHHVFGDIPVFVAYLILKIVSRIFESLLIGRYFKKHYAEVDLKIKEKLPRSEALEMFNNVKALFMHKIAGFSLRSGTTFIITKLVSAGISGIYSNYAMITSAINSLTDQFFSGITASYGDLLSTASLDTCYDRFNAIYFINYLLYSFISISFYICISPLVVLWLGNNFLFGSFTTLLITIYLYLYGMRQSIFMVRTSSGLYKQDRWFAILEAVINALAGIWLIQHVFHTIDGALLANIISCVMIPFWTQPIIVYCNLFKRNPLHYYARYAVYTVVFIASWFATYFAAAHFQFGNMLIKLVVNVVICLVVPNVINFVVFWRTREMKYLVSTGRDLLKNMIHRKPAKDE